MTVLPKPHSHFLSLPRFLSNSGLKPSLQARLAFIGLGTTLVFLLANATVAAVTEGVIFPGVSVASRDLSFKTRFQARKILQELETERFFKIQVEDKIFETTSTELGASYDLESTLDMAYSIGHSSMIPVFGFADVDKKGQLGYAFKIDNGKLKDFTSKVVSSVGKDPVNATLKIENGNIIVVADQDGLRIDQKALITLLQNSIADGKDQNLVLKPGYVKADVEVSEIGPAKARAEELLHRSIVLNYEGKQFIPDKVAKGHWLNFIHKPNTHGEIELVVEVSREQILGYLQSIANEVDIPPQNRKVTVLDGREMVDQEGKEGRAINQAPAADQILAALKDNQNVVINLTSSPVAYKTEKRRIGGALGGLDYPQYIEINLSQQRLYAWQNDQVVFTTPITSGAAGAGFPTVTGLFGIYTKERSRYLNGAQYGYNYNVYVDYWMPFYSGYGLHDADWRSSFGGADYYYGGSHGCVNMPKSSAAFLFGWAPVGTPVWIHY